jgi:hypothetical protein
MEKETWLMVFIGDLESCKENARKVGKSLLKGRECISG